MLLPQESSPFAVRHRAAGVPQGQGPPFQPAGLGRRQLVPVQDAQARCLEEKVQRRALVAVRGRGDDRHGGPGKGHMAAQAVAAAPVPGQQADDETAVRRDDQDRRVRALVFQQGRHGPHGDACCAYKDLGNFCGLSGCIHDAGKRQAVFTSKRWRRDGAAFRQRLARRPAPRRCGRGFQQASGQRQGRAAQDMTDTMHGISVGLVVKRRKGGPFEKGPLPPRAPHPPKTFTQVGMARPRRRTQGLSSPQTARG